MKWRNKKYVDWLAEETGFAAIETSKAKINEIKKFDAAVLSGGIDASGVAGITLYRRNKQIGCSFFDPILLG